MIDKFFILAFQFIRSVMLAMGYPGIVVLMAIESACIPLPSELIMPFAGYLVSQGEMNLYWAATAGALGCNVGSVFAYEAGYYGGRQVIERYGRYILMTKHDLELADRFFQKHGAAAVFVGRLLPVVRTFIALPAGIARMPRVKFHIYTFLGSWPWCFGLAYLGVLLGENWMSIKPYFMDFKYVIFAAIFAAGAWFLWSHWKNRVGAPARERASAEGSGSL